MGHTTCADSSLVDYLLCSPELLCNILNFQVLPFSEILSDKHNAVYFSFKCVPEAINAVVMDKSNVQQEDKIIWNDTKKDRFIEGLDMNRIRAIEEDLDNYLNEINQVDQDKVENVLLILKNTFEDSALKCNMIKKARKYRNSKKRKCHSKAWFTKVCEEKRKAYFKAKRESLKKTSSDTVGKGLIVPLFKKGDRYDTNNYWGITILSCLGKLFTSVINNRLTCFVDKLGIVSPEQAGFRHGFSNMDHILTFKMILDIYLSKKKKMFVAFIDYRKAFDCIDRVSLWNKMLE